MTKRTPTPKPKRKAEKKMKAVKAYIDARPGTEPDLLEFWRIFTRPMPRSKRHILKSHRITVVHGHISKDFKIVPIK